MPKGNRYRLIRSLQEFAPGSPGVETALGKALIELTGHPGKLVRARLLLQTAAALGWSEPDAVKLACALEYFHLASLALDDLPCMDDALERRGQPCVHRRHSEATAILASLALINRAYLLVQEAFAPQSQRVRAAAAALVDRCLGPDGLVGGQARDLAYHAIRNSTRDIGRIAAAKTGALFNLTVLLPALTIQLDPVESRSLRALVLYWGLAFQIVDDLRDVLSSSLIEGKTTGRDRARSRPNLALALGVAPARARLSRLATLADRSLVRLAPAGQGRWASLAAFQAEVVAAFSAEAAATAA